MSDVYKSVMQGLGEAIDDSKGKGKPLPRRTVSIEPVKRYEADDIKAIRRSTGFSQKMFAGYLGVSVKTVEAWETGTNSPSGAASRLLSMMETDNDLTSRFPFVVFSE